ncbi:MAG: hypothetical protein QM820_40940 [Minicystis sp.]
MAKHITRTLLNAMKTSWLLVALGAAAAGCSQTTGTDPDANDEISGDEASFEGTSKPENLSVQERATYQSDWAYVNKLVSNNSSVILNHADERQHRFVEMRLKLAGKTRGNAPELFKRIDETRAQHVAMGLKAGQFVPKPHGELARSVDAGRVPEHYMSSVNFLGTSSMESISTGSRIDAITYGYIDSGTWDSNGTPIGDMNYVEVYTNMPYRAVKSTGNLALTSAAMLTGDSMLIEDTVSSGHREFYVAAASTRGPSFTVPTLLEPSDHTSDGCYSICLNRSWTGDCDIDSHLQHAVAQDPDQGLHHHRFDVQAQHHQDQPVQGRHRPRQRRGPGSGRLDHHRAQVQRRRLRRRGDAVLPLDAGLLEHGHGDQRRERPAGDHELGHERRQRRAVQLAVPPRPGQPAARHQHQRPLAAPDHRLHRPHLDRVLQQPQLGRGEPHRLVHQGDQQLPRGGHANRDGRRRDAAHREHPRRRSGAHAERGG